MTGEIHGIISREDAWRMWRPYGERVIDELDGYLDHDTITPYEALTVLIGSHEYFEDELYRVGKLPTGSWNGLETSIARALSGRSAAKFKKLLVESNDFQYGMAAVARDKAIEQGAKFGSLVCNSLSVLDANGTLSLPHTDQLRQRMFASNGQPLLQHTPMSRLEYARLYTKYDKNPPIPWNSAVFVDAELGIIASGEVQNEPGVRKTKHSKVHEYVHVLQGWEIYDITRVDGWRRPVTTGVGLHLTLPSTEITDGNDSSSAANVEVNEAWNDMVSQEVMLATNGIRSHCLPSRHNVYDKLVQSLRTIRGNHPGLYQVISKAVMVEADPLHPNAKIDAIADMRTYADKILGEKNALTKYFQTGELILAAVGERAKADNGKATLRSWGTIPVDGRD